MEEEYIFMSNVQQQSKYIHFRNLVYARNPNYNTIDPFRTVPLKLSRN